MNKIDISTEKKKLQVYNLFNSFTKKQDIHKYFRITDNSSGVKYVNEIAKEIGFDLNVYKERKKRYCLYCEKELNKNQVKFCSCSCSAKYFNEGKRLKEETKKKISDSLKKMYAEKKTGECITKTCVVCEKPLPRGNRKFCCIECRKKTQKQKSKELICEYCGKTFIGYKGRKYCCNDCSNASKNEKRVNDWRIGKYVLNPNETVPDTIRNYLLNKVDYKCEECGFEGYNRKSGKTILQVHHKDGNSANNNEDNLQILCPNCHAMTENYMGLNRGKSGRTQRYKNGE